MTISERLNALINQAERVREVTGGMDARNTADAIDQMIDAITELASIVEDVDAKIEDHLK